jgi:hypothetical protein
MKNIGSLPSLRHWWTRSFCTSNLFCIQHDLVVHDSKAERVSVGGRPATSECPVLLHGFLVRVPTVVAYQHSCSYHEESKCVFCLLCLPRAFLTSPRHIRPMDLQDLPELIQTLPVSLLPMRNRSRNKKRPFAFCRQPSSFPMSELAMILHSSCCGDTARPRG